MNTGNNPTVIPILTTPPQPILPINNNTNNQPPIPIPMNQPNNQLELTYQTLLSKIQKEVEELKKVQDNIIRLNEETKILRKELEEQEKTMREEKDKINQKKKQKQGKTLTEDERKELLKLNNQLTLINKKIENWHNDTINVPSRKTQSPVNMNREETIPKINPPTVENEEKPQIPPIINQIQLPKPISINDIKKSPELPKPTTSQTIDFEENEETVEFKQDDGKQFDYKEEQQNVSGGDNCVSGESVSGGITSGSVTPDISTDDEEIETTQKQKIKPILPKLIQPIESN